MNIKIVVSPCLFTKYIYTKRGKQTNDNDREMKISDTNSYAYSLFVAQVINTATIRQISLQELRTLMIQRYPIVLMWDIHSLSLFVSFHASDIFLLKSDRYVCENCQCCCCVQWWWCFRNDLFMQIKKDFRRRHETFTSR